MGKKWTEKFRLTSKNSSLFFLLCLSYNQKQAPKIPIWALVPCWVYRLNAALHSLWSRRRVSLQQNETRTGAAAAASDGAAGARFVSNRNPHRPDLTELVQPRNWIAGVEPSTAADPPDKIEWIKLINEAGVFKMSLLQCTLFVTLFNSKYC